MWQKIPFEWWLHFLPGILTIQKWEQKVRSFLPWWSICWSRLRNTWWTLWFRWPRYLKTVEVSCCHLSGDCETNPLLPSLHLSACHADTNCWSNDGFCWHGTFSILFVSGFLHSGLIESPEFPRKDCSAYTRYVLTVRQITSAVNCEETARLKKVRQESQNDYFENKKKRVCTPWKASKCCVFTAFSYFTWIEII